MTKDSHDLPALPGEPSSEKPAGRPLSAASARLYDKWGRYQDSTSEFYTTFKYSRISGIGKERGVTRRDPSTVLRIDGKYYVWYTRRRTINDRDHLNKPPHRAQSWDTPVFDWDLAEIWYATSDDGFQLGRTGRGGAAWSARRLRRALGLHARCIDDPRPILSLLSGGRLSVSNADTKQHRNVLGDVS